MRHTQPRRQPSDHLASPYAPVRGELRDWSGRSYTVGPTAGELTGRSRSRILAGAAVAAAGAGVLQFGYGSAVPALVAAHGWSPPAALLPFVVWALAQGASAIPIARLHARGSLPPGRAVVVGAVLCAVALATLGHADRLEWAVVAYGLLGGAGAGLVYHTCVHLASAWFPEWPAAHACLAGAAFALGSVPLAAAAPAMRPENLAPACTVLAIVVAGLGVAGGRRLAAPPVRWWPPGIDPRAWALRGRAGPIACRDHSPTQAWRSGALPALHAVVALAGATALLNLAVLPLFATQRGLPAGAVAAATAALVASSGLGRVAAGYWAERAGRQRALVAVLTAGAAAQFGLLWAGMAGSTVALLLCVIPAGAGGGSCYPLTRALAVDFFGVRDSTGIQALVYSAKGAGGVLGIGGAALLLALAPGSGYAVGFCAAGVMACAAAVVAARLRRPLPVRTIPPQTPT